MFVYVDNLHTRSTSPSSLDPWFDCSTHPGGVSVLLAEISNPFIFRGLFHSVCRCLKMQNPSTTGPDDAL